MTELVTEQLRHLAETLTDLKGRVRQAVAGEVSRAVAEAVGEVLVATLGGTITVPSKWPGRPGRYDPYQSAHANGYGPEGWDDPDAPGWDPSYAQFRRATTTGSPSEGDPPESDTIGPAALAVAVAAGRWWLTRRGSPWGAAGAGLAAGASLLAGGPMARTALAVLLAVHRLLAATDALGDGAKALDRV
jgi:hypothetical protein